MSNHTLTQAETETAPDSVSRCPICLVHSDHPLVLRSIKEALRSDPVFCSRMELYQSNSKPLYGSRQQLLIMDTCSVEHWASCLESWHTDGGTAIALVSPEAYTEQSELQLLYLGAAGVLPFDNDLMINLPKAVHAVFQGHFWNRRVVLSFYVKRATCVLREASTTDRRLTVREIQVLDLVQHKASNRTIAQRLSISERTAKFHISNILRKLKLTNRREIQSLNSSSSLLCPEWLSSPQIVSHGCISFPQQRTDLLKGSAPKHRMEREGIDLESHRTMLSRAAGGP